MPPIVIHNNDWEFIMSNHRASFRRLGASAAVGALAVLGIAATPAAGTDADQDLTWLRLNACNRVERAAGHVDVDGECINDQIGDGVALGSDVKVCASHFCSTEPGAKGSRLIHPSDFGPSL